MEKKTERNETEEMPNRKIKTQPSQNKLPTTNKQTSTKYKFENVSQFCESKIIL